MKLKSGVLAEPVLEGRERELEELQSRLNWAEEGKGSTVFISGEAGSGKSRLTREFLSFAQKKSIPVLAGLCLSDAAVPYLPFVEAFNSFFGSFGEEEEPGSLQKPGIPFNLTANAQILDRESGITAWLTGQRPVDKSGKLQTFSPQVWQDQVFDGVVKTLHAISVNQPIILLFEDIHWADSASLALLHYVARAVRNSEKVLVLATFRSEELTANSEGRPHPLAETLRMMKREDLFSELKLSGLSQTSINRIAENMIGGSLQAEFAEKLAKESRGNPLFVVESLRMLHERRSLVEEGNKWRLAVDELGIPSKVRDIILRRLALLKDAQRRVLNAASVIGEKFDVELLSAVLGLDSLEVLETLNVIGNSTSLVSVEENCYRFDHARSRETLYEELSPPLKRGYHAKVAERLESADKSDKLQLNEIAYHYTEAGNKEKAVEFAMAAGQDALARFSNAEAIKRFVYVLQTIPELPGKADLRRIALEGLGDAYFANSLYEKAIETYEELATSETGSLRLRAYRKEMDVVWIKDMDPVCLMDLVKKVEKYFASDRLESAYVRWNRGRAFLAFGNYKAALEDHEEALRVFEEEYSLPEVASLVLGTGVTRTNFDLLEKGFSEILRGIAMIHELCDVRVEVGSINIAEACIFQWNGLFQEALSYYGKALKMGERIGDFGSMAYTCSRIGEVLGVVSENWTEAVSQSLKALEYAQKTDVKVIQSRTYANLTLQYARLGDLKRAEEYYGKLMKIPKEIISNWLVSFNVMFAEAILFAAKSQWKEANQHFEKIFALYKRLHIVGLEIMVRRGYAWALDRQGQTEEAQVQLNEARRLSGEIAERFGHANIQANLIAKRKVTVGEQFEMRLDLVNVARKPGSTIKIEGVTPSDGFKVTCLTPGCSLQNGNLELEERNIGPFEVKTIKLASQASKTGNYTLTPQAIYMDDLGENRTSKTNPITITIQPAKPKYEVLPGRIPTGFEELNALLFGGIPEHYAVALTSPSTDERELLITRFLDAGAATGEIVFSITAEASNAKALVEKYPSNFYLFICNPQADAIVQDQSNIFKLKGVENLTDMDIALTKAFRNLNSSANIARRICIEVVSDALLQHHAVDTRRWLSALLPTLKSKGFTILATINPRMHPSEEFEAILGLFDGEIRITEKETPEGTKQTLKVRKLVNQKYLENEVTLNKESLAV